ncbi:hypothetical protein CONPUDRAFT_163841 [Coniophora puteana RWD-64-598 SS2]|uniref:Uncharacterized protein n=1 Tax=Coniophora puteana (strain RWD-64-598) TaxID=741705 RepID=A0A5M3MUH3_CONPW|nr:uncharacterized protein CONPUDRAFT_163841 [Coniophora puteana RWD-64-598 SS2]EIW82763.1 hypothetical protein CONPUDRAFT_163841 [Coniophora puteana RWD-64-598 SS2]
MHLPRSPRHQRRRANTIGCFPVSLAINVPFTPIRLSPGHDALVLSTKDKYMNKGEDPPCPCCTLSSCPQLALIRSLRATGANLEADLALLGAELADAHALLHKLMEERARAQHAGAASSRDARALEHRLTQLPALLIEAGAPHASIARLTTLIANANANANADADADADAKDENAAASALFDALREGMLGGAPGTLLAQLADAVHDDILSTLTGKYASLLQIAVASGVQGRMDRRAARFWRRVARDHGKTGGSEGGSEMGGSETSDEEAEEMGEERWRAVQELMERRRWERRDLEDEGGDESVIRASVQPTTSPGAMESSGSAETTAPSTYFDQAVFASPEPISNIPESSNSPLAVSTAPTSPSSNDALAQNQLITNTPAPPIPRQVSRPLALRNFNVAQMPRVRAYSDASDRGAEQDHETRRQDAQNENDDGAQRNVVDANAAAPSRPVARTPQVPSSLSLAQNIPIDSCPRSRSRSARVPLTSNAGFVTPASSSSSAHPRYLSSAMYTRGSTTGSCNVRSSARVPSQLQARPSVLRPTLVPMRRLVYSSGVNDTLMMLSASTSAATSATSASSSSSSSSSKFSASSSLSRFSASPGPSPFLAMAGAMRGDGESRESLATEVEGSPVCKGGSGRERGLGLGLEDGDGGAVLEISALVLTPSQCQGQGQGPLASSESAVGTPSTPGAQHRPANEGSGDSASPDSPGSDTTGSSTCDSGSGSDCSPDTDSTPLTGRESSEDSPAYHALAAAAATAAAAPGCCDTTRTCASGLLAPSMRVPKDVPATRAAPSDARADSDIVVAHLLSVSSSPSSAVPSTPAPTKLPTLAASPPASARTPCFKLSENQKGVMSGSLAGTPASVPVCAKPLPTPSRLPVLLKPAVRDATGSSRAHGLGIISTPPLGLPAATAMASTSAATLGSPALVGQGFAPVALVSPATAALASVSSDAGGRILDGSVDSGSEIGSEESDSPEIEDGL